MSIKSLGDRCIMTYKYCMNQPMQAVERQMNMIIAKNPQLINLFKQNKNHPPIRKYSHIPFNN